MFTVKTTTADKEDWNQGHCYWYEANVAVVCSLEHVELNVMCQTKGDKMFVRNFSR